MQVDIHLKADYFSRRFIEQSVPSAGAAVASNQQQHKAVAPSHQPAKKEGKKPSVLAVVEEEDKLVLTEAEMGKVLTRFPPEASGFIHIGHAKAALVNRMLATKYQGKMLLRFDDTNPAKEKAHFEEAIIEDLKSLGVTWDIGPTFTSDNFDFMLEKADELIERGMAYCDMTGVEEMRQARFDGVATKCRSHSIEENKRLWQEMKEGTELGQKTCLRAKISVDDPNKAMRDPTIYRVNLLPHGRTGSKYKVYPTYDFACPIIDSIEGVTHALRTNEYHDRNAQFEWVCRALSLRCPRVEDFSRLNLEYTVMSKRKLTQLVNDKVVDGWDDPRFPTVRALIRRGLKVDALREFVKVQGMSKAINLIEWSKLWNFNSQILDPAVPRYAAVSASLCTKCAVQGQAHLERCERARHKKNPALGNKPYFKSDTIFLDAEDVALLHDGDEVTLMDWGNAFVKDIQISAQTNLPVAATVVPHPEGDVKKTKYKLHWVSENDTNVKLVLNEYDHLLTKKKPEPDEPLDGLIAAVTKFSQPGIGEPAMAELKPRDFLQIERRGFYVVDAINSDGTIVLIAIPDGKDKVNHLSAKAQYLKTLPPSPTTVAAAEQKKKKGGATKEDDLTLEEKRAAKAAKKAASAAK